MRKRITISFLVLLCLLLAACTSSQVLVTIQAVLNGIAALQTALPTAGVSPALAKEISEYASAAATGVGQCSALLAAGGDTATLVTKCGQFLSAAVQPVLPPGTPMQIAGLVSTVYSEIQVVYATIEASAPAPAPAPVKASVLRPRAAKTTTPAAWNPSKRDAAKMLALATKAMALAKAK